MGNTFSRKRKASHDYSPSSATVSVTSAEHISVDAIPGRAAVVAGVEQTMNMLVRIRTPAPPAGITGPALHVACVLDRSGSMNGRKLLYAKRAVRKLVRHLDALNCKLSFVTYDSAVERVFHDGDLNDKDGLAAQIKATICGSTTNLHGGLQEGAECLRELARTSNEAPAVRRIFLFSDGLVNAGVRDAETILTSVDGLAADGITVSAFGIGTDFDESLMTRIAKRGLGHFHFLETEEAIPRLVSQSVHSLLHVAGTEARLEVRGVHGAVVKRIHAADEDDDDDDIDPGDGGAATASHAGELSLGDLHWNNTRQVLLELKVSPPGLMPGATSSVPQPVLEFDVSFCGGHTTAKKARVQLTGTASVDVVANRKELAAEDGDVASAAAIVSAYAADARAVKLLNDGDSESAIALKEQQIHMMSELLKTLAKEPRYRDGCCVRLAAVTHRARRTLEHLKEGKHARAVAMEMRYEMRVGRAMSDNGMEERADSENGCYSDAGLDDDLSPRFGGPAIGQGLISRSPSFGALSDGYSPTSPQYSPVQSEDGHGGGWHVDSPRPMRAPSPRQDPVWLTPD